ncbi:MAG: 1,4-alpha-glucan branching protein GlgB [Clostridiales bacterium]|jgi:1,4-alpha-glucan branching enzyme|nr:1,4-alpha-glucan branching protein GlgB [Clostridiales bacterium]
MDELSTYLFHQGTNYQSYKYLGCHFGKKGSKSGAYFRVYAPRAREVSVVGDFNEWNADSNVCQRLTSKGIWECFVPGVKRFDNYKFCITTDYNERLLKSDPFAFHSETEGGSASKAYGLPEYKWADKSYIDFRKSTDILKQPVNIYEVFPAAWRKYSDGNYFNYRAFADEILPYVKKTGYTHIEIIGVAEFPFMGSWGYQVTGYFAPTSRYGTPEDLMYLVNTLHAGGVGVIIDWVPGHFPRDTTALARFDGYPLYEHPDPKKGEHKEWGTYVFDYGREETQSFLVSGAMYWFDIFHIDGLRVDAVASMLYLDYNRRDGEWTPNSFGGKEHLEAIAFIKKLNETVFKSYPYAMMIAEESTAWPAVTKPTYAGGLGFNFKWNMGWMHDTLEYMQKDPLFRRNAHNNMTFSFMYAFSENFILPLSHDEVVHGKGSMIGKMFGSYNDKFAGLRAYYAYMTAHPGKKLLFMGGEFGQFIEWDYRKQLDWQLLEFPAHASLLSYVSALNGFYLENGEFWELDAVQDGFNCISANDRDSNVFVFSRKSASGGEIFCVFNFSPVLRPDYYLTIGEGDFETVFNSDDAAYGGTGASVGAELKSVGDKNFGHIVKINLPPLSALYLRKKEEEKLR